MALWKGVVCLPEPSPPLCRPSTNPWPLGLDLEEEKSAQLEKEGEGSTRTTSYCPASPLWGEI